MPNQYTRADALREYLTGAASDGGVQTSPSACLGNYRSSTEAVSLGIVIANALAGVTVLYAGGANPLGVGILTAVDTTNLTWKPAGAVSAGLQVSWSGAATQIVEAANAPGEYLRISATPPFTPGTSQITLSALYNNAFGFDNVSVVDAASGQSYYRASIVRNESGAPVASFARWITQLGTSQTSTGGGLSASGAGIITTTGSFADWPARGWCQVQNSGGTLKEIVYYASRTSTVLTVPAAGRARLGTSATAGTITDLLFAVPGIAIALEPGGAQAFGNAIQTIANQNTAPAGVTWSTGLTAGTGLNIGTLGVNQQQGIWIWREIPAGAGASPALLNEFSNSFQTF